METKPDGDKTGYSKVLKALEEEFRQRVTVQGHARF